MLRLLILFLLSSCCLSISAQVDSLRHSVLRVEETRRSYTLPDCERPLYITTQLDGRSEPLKLNERNLLSFASPETYSAEDRSVSRIKKYNIKGKLVEDSVFQKNHQYVDTYKYDTSGNVIEKRTTFKNGESVVTKYFYDYRGLTDEINFSENRSEDIKVIHYEREQNKLIRKTESRGAGRLSRSVSMYTYDSSGNILTDRYEGRELVKDSSTNNIVWKDTSLYSITNRFIYRNNLITEKIYGHYSFSTLASRILYFYDEKFRKKEEQFFYESPDTARLLYSYYPNNLLRKITRIENNYELSITSIEYFYNENNVLIKAKLIDDEKTVVYGYDYTFDKNNNWVKLMVSYNGYPYLLRKREISYY